MNIKSLLLGSAAALLAVSGARAADAVAVAAEPEPMDYVRICDTYGAKFYYIPGTETCLRVGGFVRYDIGFGNDNAVYYDREQQEVVGLDSPYGWSKSPQASIQLDAREETELGTLRAFIDARIKPASASLDKAYIQLGGFTVGYASNAFDFDLGGEQDILGNGTFNVVQYTFNGGNGFTATVSLDDDSDVISGIGAFKTPGVKHTGADFMPNVSANIIYASGPVSFGVYGGYDNNTENAAVKAIGSYSFTDSDKLSLAGYYSSGANYLVGGGTLNSTAALPLFRSSVEADVGGTWSVQGEYWHRFNEKFAASLGAVYINDVGYKDDFPGGRDQLNFWRVGTTIDYTIVPNFNIKTNINYNQFNGKLIDLVTSGDKPNKGFVDGFVRFQRDF